MLWALLLLAWIPYGVIQLRRVLSLGDPDAAVPAAVELLPLGCGLLVVVLLFVSQFTYFLYVARCFRERPAARHCKALGVIGALSVPIGTVLAVFALRALAREDA
jgi:hypothetical protein